MLLLKITGSILVLAASTLLGYVLSRDCIKRPQQLRELQALLQMFENEITYLSSPLAEAFKKLGQAGRTKVSDFFTFTAAALEQERALTASDAWEKAVTAAIRSTALSKEDEAVLLTFGKILGSSDLDGQIRNIRLTLTQLGLQEKKAEESRTKNESMYRRLGVLGGLALVIVLF